MAKANTDVATLKLPEDMEHLRQEAVQSLRGFLKVKEPTVLTVAAARIAGSALSSCTRFQQALSANKAIDVSIASQLAEDKEQLRRYIEITMPDHPLARALPAPSNNVT